MKVCLFLDWGHINLTQLLKGENKKAIMKNGAEFIGTIDFNRYRLKYTYTLAGEKFYWLLQREGR